MCLCVGEGMWAMSPSPPLFLLFILETGSYKVAHAGLELVFFFLSLLNFEGYNTTHSQEDTVLTFMLQVRN